MSLNFNQPWISQLLGLAAVLIGGWWAKRHTTPTEQQRAAHLAQIAADAAALVVSLNPAAAWATLLESTVQQIVTAAGLPVSNRAAIERAAAGALTALGKAPAGA